MQDILYTAVIFGFFWTYSVGCFLVSKLARQFVDLEDEDGVYGHAVIPAPLAHVLGWPITIPYLVLTDNFETPFDYDGGEENE